MAWSVAAGDLKGLTEFVLLSIASNLEVLADIKLILMFFLKMEFIDKYARVDGSDDDDDAMFAGGDEVNYSDVEFIDDKTNIQDQVPSHYRIINITRDLQNAMGDCYMTGELYLVCCDLKILFPSAWKKLHTNLMNLKALRTA